MTDERFKQWTDTIKNVNELLADYGKLDEHFRKISYDHYKLEEKNEKLIEENEQLKKALADAQEVIKGYKESMMQDLGLDEKENLAEMQFEKGVKVDA